jgi:hypothetical protein
MWNLIAKIVAPASSHLSDPSASHLCELAAPAPFLPGSDGLPVRRHAANARGSLALHIGGVSRNEDALRHACSRRRRPTHAGPGALKVAIFCRWALRRRLCRKGGQITAIQTKLTCCRVPKFWMRKGNCLSGHANCKRDRKRWHASVESDLSSPSRRCHADHSGQHWTLAGFGAVRVFF